MIELLRAAAARDADAVAIVTADERWTYGRLVARADAYAAGLRAAGIERCAIVTNDIPELVALLAASSVVGVEACTYEPIISLDDLARQADAFDHEVVISDRPDLGPLAEAGRDIREPRSLVTVGAVPLEDLPERRPLLVLTTGSTGFPKGVRHDWSRQVSRALTARGGAGQVWLLAYGPQQFAGLQVLVHVLGTGATLVSPPVRRPQAVVDAIHQNGVTHISATPTFWRFLLAELRADSRPLPALQQITLGGEAASAGLLDDLTATFPDARVSHIYAGSEFGSTGSVSDRRNGLPASLLERGGDGEVELKIVDGELFVRSTASMLGYHGEDDRAVDEWWPTGDVVEVVGDRIEFRGRHSDVINVGGVKVHPLPVEDRVAAVAGVRAARVYGRANALVGAVVAVDVLADGTVEPDDLKAAVRAACADLPRPYQPRSVRVVDEIEVKGGKTLRGGA